MFIWSPGEFSPPIKFIGSAVAIEVIIAASASATAENTPDRWQSKTLLTIDERGSKIFINGVFLLPFVACRAILAIENCVSNNFDLRKSILLTFSIAAYPVWEMFM